MKFNLRQVFLAVSSNCKRLMFSNFRSGIEMSSCNIVVVVINAKNGSVISLDLPLLACV